MRGRHALWVVVIVVIAAAVGTSIWLGGGCTTTGEPSAKAATDRLIAACIDGDAVAASAAIAQGADVNNRAGVHRRLCEALLMGHVEVVRVLIANGADRDVGDGGPSPQYPIEYAASGGSVEAFDIVWGAGGRSPHGVDFLLCLSLPSGQRLIVDRLLAAGADPNCRVGPGYNSLFYCDTADDARYMLSLGADPNRRASGLWPTPLHYAASAYSVEVIRTLLRAGADPCARNEDGKRPSDLADGEARDLLIAAERGLTMGGSATDGP